MIIITAVLDIMDNTVVGFMRHQECNANVLCCHPDLDIYKTG